MAKKKASKKKAGPKKFVVLFSVCGGVSQLEHLSGSDTFTTAQAARDYLKDSIESGDYGTDGTFVIAEIIDVGKPTGMEWTGNTSLDD